MRVGQLGLRVNLRYTTIITLRPRSWLKWEKPNASWQDFAQMIRTPTTKWSLRKALPCNWPVLFLSDSRTIFKTGQLLNVGTIIYTITIQKNTSTCLLTYASVLHKFSPQLNHHPHGPANFIISVNIQGPPFIKGKLCLDRFAPPSCGLIRGRDPKPPTPFLLTKLHWISILQVTGGTHPCSRWHRPLLLPHGVDWSVDEKPITRCVWFFFSGHEPQISRWGPHRLRPVFSRGTAAELIFMTFGLAAPSLMEICSESGLLTAGVFTRESSILCLLLLDRWVA